MRFFCHLWHGMRDMLFPVRCCGCETWDTWLCIDCHSALPLYTQQYCPLCRKHPTPTGRTCLGCRSKTALDGVTIASSYNCKALTKALHLYKYRFVRELADPLAVLLAQSIVHAKIPLPDLVVPVPLHPRRERWRGFNQAQLLAEYLELRCPVANTLLVRGRHTVSQVHTRSRAARLQNMSNAFVVAHPDVCAGASILLIDDVMTTGATLEECARALKRAGAQSVTALVVARE